MVSWLFGMSHRWRLGEARASRIRQPAGCGGLGRHLLARALVQFLRGGVTQNGTKFSPGRHFHPPATPSRMLVPFACLPPFSVCLSAVFSSSRLPQPLSARRLHAVCSSPSGASRRYLTMRGHLRFVMCFAALGGTAATTEVRNSFTESRGRSGTCSPGAACDGDTRCDRGVSPSKVRFFSDAAPHSAAICAPVNGHLTGTFFSAFGFGGLLQWLMAVISILVVACVLGAEALARARDSRKPMMKGTDVPRGERARRRLGRRHHCLSSDAPLPNNFAPW